MTLGWHPLVVETAHAMGHRRDLERLRPELEAWVAECGIEEPWCRDASVVPHHRTDDPVAWARPLARYEFDATCYAVLSACYYLTSALTGMRAWNCPNCAQGAGTANHAPAAALVSG
ncbi:hypothetical protein FXW78_46150 [Rhodococcus opacus]|nr:hypothetical protein [Rhodococcus opacus]